MWAIFVIHGLFCVTLCYCMCTPFTHASHSSYQDMNDMKARQQKGFKTLEKGKEHKKRKKHSNSSYTLSSEVKTTEECKNST